MDDLQRQRARQFAICTYALRYDHASDGAEAIFDQGLTNGLAAIVSAAWPGRELNRWGRVLSADQLLTVIEEHATESEEAGVRLVLHDPDGPLYEDDLALGDPMPNFTEVRVETLRDAIARTQAVRHARAMHPGDAADLPSLTDADIEALQLLDHHPVVFSLSDEMIDRAEATVAHDARVEAERAEGYWLALGEEERERRSGIDYRSEFGPRRHDDETQIQECPVCGNQSLVASHFDAYTGDVGVGTCIACSFDRNQAMADDSGLMAHLTDLARRDD